MTPEKRERYARWQNYRITQLSFSINLFLGFSVASMAYVINLLLGDAKGNDVLECVLIVWAISAASGCLGTISRLLDFKYTAQKIRSPNKCNKFFAKYLGYGTWIMFWFQILLYSYGAFQFIHKYVLANGV